MTWKPVWSATTPGRTASPPRGRPTRSPTYRELRRLYEDRQISDTTRRRIQRALDLEETGLTE
jgi:hypothetical protein